MSDFDWQTELHLAEGDAALAQELFDTGLLAQVNAAVLHPHGLALGVVMGEGKVAGLSLHQSSDPDGIWFDEDTTVAARRKMRAAGLLRERR